MEIKVRCGGIVCDKEFKVEAITPTGWSEPESIFEPEIEPSSPHYGWLCPDCVKQREWFDQQCPGCVAGYPDCGLGKSFVYSNKTIQPEQLDIIRRGICPFRVNGTMMFDTANPGQGIQKIDLSGVASTDSGNAVADAIVRYITPTG